MRNNSILYRTILWISWWYLAFVLFLLLTIVIGGERWWPATMILFGPRWLAALPLIFLLPLAAWLSRQSLIPLLSGTLIIFGPFMGFNLPLKKTGVSGAKVLRVVTCNIDNGNCDVKSLAALILESQADIVALQESPRDIASSLKLPVGWHHVQDNSLAVLSRFPLQRVSLISAIDPPHVWPRGCSLQVIAKVTGQDLAFFSVHLPSPRYGLQHVLDRYKLVNQSRAGLLIEETSRRWQTARNVQQEVVSQPLPVIVAGDFNMPNSSAIYRDVWKTFENAFSKNGFGYGWTVRADVRGIPVKVRVDHILTGVGLGALICDVGPDVGSDHLPLIADIAIKKGVSGEPGIGKIH